MNTVHIALGFWELFTTHIKSVAFGESEETCAVPSYVPKDVESFELYEKKNVSGNQVYVMSYLRYCTAFNAITQLVIAKIKHCTYLEHHTRW